MNKKLFEITYNQWTGLIETEVIPKEIIKELLEESKISETKTDGKTMYLVNPYIFKVENPCPMLLNLFSYYKNNENIEINHNYLKYQDYLKTDYWKSFRQKSLEHYENKCNWCGADGEEVTMHVHHIKYGEWFNEELENVILLCGSCHSKAHGKSK